MSRVSGGSELRRTMVGLRCTQLSDVASSRWSKVDGSNSLSPFCTNSQKSFSSSSSLDESSSVMMALLGRVISGMDGYDLACRNGGYFERI